MSRRSVPAYSLRRGNGQACVTIDGRRIYLGVHGSPESHRRYAAEISEWQARQNESTRDTTVGQLTVLYMEHCRRHYQ